MIVLHHFLHGLKHFGRHNRLVLTGVKCVLVRNLADGQVELLAEGPAEEVDRFLDALARKMAENIESRRETMEPIQGFTEFEIRY